MEFFLIGAAVAMVILLIGGGIASIFIVGLVKERRRLNLIVNTPLTWIRDLQPGYAKVEGAATAALRRLLRSPLRDRDCLYYDFVVDEQRTRTAYHGPHGGASSHRYWANIIRDRYGLPILIQDKTGEVGIHLEDAEITMNSSDRQRSGMFNDPPPRLQRMLQERYNTSTHGWIFNKTLRYSETVVEEGDRLMVLGEVEIDRGQARFVPGPHPILVSDKGEDGLRGHYQSRVTGKIIWLVVVCVLTVVILGIAIAAALFLLIA